MTEISLDIDLRKVCRVKQSNELPSKICQSCKSIILQFHVFKQKCNRAESVLRSMLEHKPQSIHCQEQNGMLNSVCERESKLEFSPLVEYIEETIEEEVIGVVLSSDTESVLAEGTSWEESHPDKDDTVKDEDIYFSDLCEETLLSVSSSHIITHLEKFPCPLEGCGCEYGSLARLTIHISNHHVDYLSPNCPHCKEEIDRVDLRQHVRLYCKAKQFECTHCGTHTGERPYVCTICNKSYKTPSLRTAHMDTHIEGKTFKCEMCGKSLQTRACYRNHVKRHLEQ
uniref:C2H2-type domain-containing protein n=1 Tax=Anopheles epiroticus TaxID=199890 RepID=A0A182PUG3_9DIPT